MSFYYKDIESKIFFLNLMRHPDNSPSTLVSCVPEKKNLQFQMLPADLTPAFLFSFSRFSSPAKKQSSYTFFPKKKLLSSFAEEGGKGKDNVTETDLKENVAFPAPYWK
ncbi:hypothetical protein AVEN_38330-1 [Araneus ventricosus]|uniref:Uncharacterized protein n=1 Tax=Araneus ventricosus TaxID=182803 RepID=A0A4Y2TU31_ARAVE|nr:hypothetical protein AVEN_38330-1 [Araneus ventricosus]